jgi:hypothetical protein
MLKLTCTTVAAKPTDVRVIDNVIEGDSTFANLLVQVKHGFASLSSCLQEYRLHSYIESTESAAKALHNAITALKHLFEVFIS